MNPCPHLYVFGIEFYERDHWVNVYEHLDSFVYWQNAFQKGASIFIPLAGYENKAAASLMWYPCHLLFTYTLSIS